MEERIPYKFITNPHAGIITVGFFILWVVIAEYGPLLINKELGGFIWVTFHFILNPILGVVLSLFLIWHAFSQKQIQNKILSITAMCFPILVSYAGFSGNIWFVELLGINFN